MLPEEKVLAAVAEARLANGGIDLTLLECGLVRAALDASRWNLSAAAKLLGMSRDQVRYRMVKFAIRKQEPVVEQLTPMSDDELAEVERKNAEHVSAVLRSAKPETEPAVAP